ncbi:MAG: hypothetical protein CMK96_12235 [Pseudomonas sp.]|jgi:ATPase subunit of ABC transporter with duplicated ATPase domains|nr:hypothetical protein [Pseudomonas sp.]MAK87664.1 hypothetical protein [Pseudomonas sp.]|tara:strand:+ start:1071 stop:1559 length:489 start_codon:yes stop_codon:yes gene_type:complete
MTTKQNTKQHVGRPMTFNQADLDARIEKAVGQYIGSHAACHHVDEPILIRYTEKVIELASQGYTLHPSLPCHAAPGNYSGYMLKPESLQVQEIEKLKAEVEAKYEAEVQAFNAEQESILAEQLYQAQKKKEEEAEKKKEEKLREQARKEAADYFASITKEGK